MGLFSTFHSRVALMDSEATNVIEFDATMSISYTGNAQLTDHPVEGTLDVTDHIRRMPKELQMRVVVSDDPIMILASLRRKSATANGDPDARAADAFFFLEGLKDLGSLVHVTTSLWDMENMVITALGCTRDKNSGNIVDMTLTLREIMIAETEEVKTAPGKPLNKGKRTKKTAPPAIAGKVTSLLSKLFSAFGG